MHIHFSHAILFQKLLVVLSNVTDEKHTEYWQQVGKVTGGATHLMNLFEKFVTKIIQLLPQAQSDTFEAVSDDMGKKWEIYFLLSLCH
jgi:hypothetical protein